MNKCKSHKVRARDAEKPTLGILAINAKRNDSSYLIPHLINVLAIFRPVEDWVRCKMIFSFTRGQFL